MEADEHIPSGRGRGSPSLPLRWTKDPVTDDAACRHMPSPLITLITLNHAVRARVQAQAAAAGGACLSTVALEEVPPQPTPDAVIVDLELERSLEAPPEIRQRWPHTLVAGFISTPDRGRWEAALARGYDLVANRGAIGAQTLTRLETWEGPPRVQRIRLFEAADAAGRLGLVFRTADTPVGPVAVYQVGKQLFCVGDVCPHAGAALSEGEIHEGVVTCPRHGSQFDVRDGGRVRGPSDEPIASHPVIVQDGVVWIEAE